MVRRGSFSDRLLRRQRAALEARPVGRSARALRSCARRPRPRSQQSPSKSAFVAQLIETYREPERIARAWGIALSSWDALRAENFALSQERLGDPAVIRDLAAFTRYYAETYFRTVAEALHRHDPDHLYLGSRFAWQTTEAVEACAHWCDVVSFNRYRRSIADDRKEWS